MLQQLWNLLFAPFHNEKLCLWFLAFTVIGFLGLVMALYKTGVDILKGRDIKFIALFMAFVLYFQSRLIYSMCAASIK